MQIILAIIFRNVLRCLKFTCAHVTLKVVWFMPNCSLHNLIMDEENHPDISWWIHLSAPIPMWFFVYWLIFIEQTLSLQWLHPYWVKNCMLHMGTNLKLGQHERIVHALKSGLLRNHLGNQEIHPREFSPSTELKRHARSGCIKFLWRITCVGATMSPSRLLHFIHVDLL